MLEDIFKLLTTFTEEAQASAISVCEEKGFNKKPEQVSLEEAFINVTYCRNIIVDAIEKQKLIQLPITLQTSLLKLLSEVSRALTSLNGGADEVLNLTRAIEELNVTVWQYGLQNLSAEVL